jgi:hypothetical protein
VARPAVSADQIIEAVEAVGQRQPALAINWCDGASVARCAIPMWDVSVGRTGMYFARITGGGSLAVR